MQPVRIIRSRTVVLPEANIDTDQIFPARFLTTTGGSGFADMLFADWRFDKAGRPRPDFALNRARSRRLRNPRRGPEFRRRIVARARALGAARLRLSRGRQLIDRGHLLQQCAEERPRAGEGGRGDACLAACKSRRGNRNRRRGGKLRRPDGGSADFVLDPFARHCLLEGVDELGYLLSKLPEIEAWERARKE